MFTGLIRHVGALASRNPRGGGARLRVAAGPALLERAAAGASIAVMGACLTVVSRDGEAFDSDLSAETLARTTLGLLPVGARLNLEAALLAGEALDGHLVTGHVDCRARLLERCAGEGLWRFETPAALAPMVAPKGSVAVDGVSLTVAGVDDGSFTVALIPETVAATTLGGLSPGDLVNLEADPVGRYVARFLSLGGTGYALQEFAKFGWGSRLGGGAQ